MGNRRKNTSMEIAYREILQKIMSEQFTPGTPLREDHLAAELGVSSTPIREAFRRLEYEGWLQSSPFRGVFLRKFSRRDIFELYQLRSALESAAAAEAAGNRTSEDIQQIQMSLEQEKEYLRNQEDRPKVKPHLTPDVVFHDAIAEASHNQIVMQRLNMLKAQIYCAHLNWRHAVVVPREDLVRVMEEHWMIFQAIRRQWSDLAKALMEKHIICARDHYMKYISDPRKDE